jgi:quinol monooxygenase YgiN
LDHLKLVFTLFRFSGSNLSRGFAMPEQAHIFRVDKFIVPEAARAEFLQRVHATHQVLRQQPGFVRDTLLEQFSGPGRFNFVTIAQWQNQAAVDAARSVVMAAHAADGFNAQEMIQRLGIEADIGNYQVIAD